MTQRWADVAFLHWRVEPHVVEAILPAGLEPDLYDSSAWVSLVGFEMRQLRLRGMPAVPTTQRFLEFNVRTYVVGPEGPGVWFASLDVAGLLAVLGARIGFALPYCLSRVQRHAHDREVRWDVARRWPGAARGGFTLAVGESLTEPDELDDWLTARWALYAATRSGRLVWAPVHHEPWPLHTATVVAHDAGLAASAGLGVVGEPARSHHATGVDVRVGRPRLLDPASQPRLVVYFDQDCGVCDASVAWLRRRTGGRVDYRPSCDLPAGSPLVGPSREALVAVAGHRTYAGCDAVVAALARATRPWRLVAEVLSLPPVRPVAARVYRWVARNRQRLSRRLGLDACSIG